jgi:hypothetical protein
MVERRLEGLKVPGKQPKKGRLWLNDGSCLRLRPERPDHVWSCDFVEDRTHDGRKFRMLNVIEEFTRECLAIRVDRKLISTDVDEPKRLADGQQVLVKDIGGERPGERVADSLQRLQLRAGRGLERIALDGRGCRAA